MLVQCFFSDPDYPHQVNIDHAFRKVSGWEKPRHGGGLHGLTLREEHHDYACNACVDRLKRGLSLEQITLIPKDER